MLLLLVNWNVVIICTLLVLVVLLATNLFYTRMAKSPVVSLETSERKHFEYLTNFFKWLISVLLIAAAIGVYLIGESVSDIKQDVREDLTQLKEQISAIEMRGNRYIDDVKEDSRIYLATTREISDTYLKGTEHEVKYLALQSAKNEIAEAFNRNNINELITAVIDQEFRNDIKTTIDGELHQVKTSLDILPYISAAYSQIGNGSYKDLKYLDSIATYHSDQSVREIAYSFLIRKGIEYENEYGRVRTPEEISRSHMLKYSKISEEDITNPVKRNEHLRIYISNILYQDASVDNLETVVGSFILVRYLLNDESIRTFDLERIRQIQKELRL